MGYSGNNDGKNNPLFQAIPNVGPIPQGKWKVVSLMMNTLSHGPYVLVLAPAEGTETYGRSGFLCHGDSIEHPGLASNGCIIQSRAMREAWWASEDRDLEVVP